MMSRNSSRQNVGDDEALARMLQFEEQTQRSPTRAAASSHRRWHSTATSQQEMQDLELARQFARMDMESTTPRSSRNSLENSSLFSSPTPTMRRATSADEDCFLTTSFASSPMLGEESLLQDSSVSAGHRRRHSVDDTLAYVRRLQEQAFSDIEQNSPRKTAAQATIEETDLEVARRMQEIEIGSIGRLKTDDIPSDEGSLGEPFSGYGSYPSLGSQEQDDEKLARFMEESGASIRNFSQQELSSMLENETTLRSASNSATFAGASHDIPQIQNESTPPPAMEEYELNFQVVPRSSPMSSVPDLSSATSSIPRSSESTNSCTRQQHVSEDSQSSNVAATAPAANDANLDVAATPANEQQQNKKKKRIFLGFRGRNPGSNRSSNRKPPPNSSDSGSAQLPPSVVAAGIPRGIPPPPGGSLSVRPTARPGPLPHSVAGRRDISQNISQTPINAVVPNTQRETIICAACRRSGGSFIVALDQKYHVGCFRCVSCYERIDPSEPFAFSTDDKGKKHPHHRRCFAQIFGISCAVCKNKIPANHDGTVSFVKHPFFDSELMCPRHAESPGRRCAGCHRFEPVNEPFADLDDGDRCVCYSCCRSVVVDSSDVRPLWTKVISFFEKLNLPIWDDMRRIPILVVQSDALNDQMNQSNSAHKGSSQIMASGLCLTDHDHCQRFKLPSLRYEKSTSSFEALDEQANGFTYYEVPRAGRGNPSAKVVAILCLSGLPRDLTASILAHEATHAWIKLHPSYDVRKPLPAQVEEGVAQLMAMLLLTDGLDPPDSSPSYDMEGPSDEKLRQYFKFSIEREDNEIYGAGYRKAAMAYSDIGIQALLSHIVRYREFPCTQSSY